MPSLPGSSRFQFVLALAPILMESPRGLAHRVALEIIVVRLTASMHGRPERLRGQDCNALLLCVFLWTNIVSFGTTRQDVNQVLGLWLFAVKTACSDHDTSMPKFAGTSHHVVHHLR